MIIQANIIVIAVSLIIAMGWGYFLGKYVERSRK